jgi:transposase
MLLKNKSPEAGRGTLEEALHPSRIGVDETAFKKRHDYVAIVPDQEAGTVLHVGKDRKKETLKAWYESLTEEQCETIESVSMDMWPAFINATLESLPDAEEKKVRSNGYLGRYVVAWIRLRKLPRQSRSACGAF